MNFRISGHIKPYVRMTRKGKYTSPDAQQYLASQDAIRWQLRQVMLAASLEMLPDEPLQAELVFCLTRNVHISDLDNQVKAVLDAAQGVVFHNDNKVDQIKAVRWLLPAGQLVDLCLFSIRLLEAP